MKAVRLVILHLSKRLGLFTLARWWTRHALRILCYHGFGDGDETMFRPGLFMRSETFERRLRHVRDRKYPVLDLGEALVLLKAGTLPTCAMVITVDDGFYGTYNLALPRLRKFDFPVTLYVTTYYVVKETPIFRLVVQYLFWKTTVDRIDGSSLPIGLTGTFDLGESDTREALAETIMAIGETRLSEDDRVELCAGLGRLLGVPFDEIQRRRMVSVMTTEEIARAAGDGVDIELHTHRHRLSGGDVCVTREIDDNRAVLEPLVGARLQHLCYPSGVWSVDWWPSLLKADIKSAATCDAGFNYSWTPALGLKRFLDGEDIAQIEFEAELSGLMEILRRVRARWRGESARGGSIDVAATLPAERL